MMIAVATHHTRAHGSCQTKGSRSFSICFSYFGMICKSQIIVQTPYDHFLSAKFHPVSNFAFQFWKCKITMSPFPVLANGSLMPGKLFKNICHNPGTLV